MCSTGKRHSTLTTSQEQHSGGRESWVASQGGLAERRARAPKMYPCVLFPCDVIFLAGQFLRKEETDEDVTGIYIPRSSK